MHDAAHDSRLVTAVFSGVGVHAGVVLQVECHVLHGRPALRRKCADLGMLVVAWSPLGLGADLEHDTVRGGNAHVFPHLRRRVLRRGAVRRGAGAGGAAPRDAGRGVPALARAARRGACPPERQ